MDGPYHVDGGNTVALAAIAAATFPSINTFWPLALAVAGADGMIGSHFRGSYLYGILVTEDGNGNILLDLLGYSGVEGSGY